MESCELEKQEVLDKSENWKELNRLLELRDQTHIPQAKNIWVKEVDTNSKFFHKCVKRKGRAKDLRGVRIKGKWLEGVQQVKH